MTKKKAENSSVSKTMKDVKPSPEQKETTKAKPVGASSHFKRNAFWYVSTGLFLGVLAWQCYPLLEKKPFGQSAEAISRTGFATQVELVSEEPSLLPPEDVNIQGLDEKLSAGAFTLEEAMKLLQKNEQRTLEHLDGMAKTTLGLGARLSQLQAELENLRIQKESEDVSFRASQSSNPVLLGQMVIFLVDAYQRGNVTRSQMEELKAFATQKTASEKLTEAIDSLISATPSSPVTLSEISLLTLKLKQKGIADEKNLMEADMTDGSFFAKIKRYLSSWVQVKKVSHTELTNEWYTSLSDVETFLVKGDVERAFEVFENSKALGGDNRPATFNLKEKMQQYLQQQRVLRQLMQSYGETYMVGVQ